MDIETFRNYCLSLPGVSESFPFDDETLCFLIAGKIFALAPLEKSVVNLKCDPERAVELREHYEGIEPGWHMNKKHWNTVLLHSDIPHDLFCSLVRHSYNSVLRSLSKIQRSKYEFLSE